MCGRNGSVPRPCRGWGTGRRALRGYEGRTETPLQNSQRVLLAKPSTAAVSRHGRCSAAARAGRPGGQSSRSTATGYGRCASWRRDGDIAPYRNGTRAMRGLAARWGHRALPQRDTGDGDAPRGAGQWDRTTGAARGRRHVRSDLSLPIGVFFASLRSSFPVFPSFSVGRPGSIFSDVFLYAYPSYHSLFGCHSQSSDKGCQISEQHRFRRSG